MCGTTTMVTTMRGTPTMGMLTTGMPMPRTAKPMTIRGTMAGMPTGTATIMAGMTTGTGTITCRRIR